MSLAVYICIESSRLPVGSWRDPGPGFFPLLSGIFLGFLSGLVFVRAFLHKKKELGETGYPKEKRKSFIFVLVVLFGYAFLLEIFGFLLSTFLLLIFLFRGIEPQRWVVSIGGSALASVISYAVFQLWLKTQLPTGILGF